MFPEEARGTFLVWAQVLVSPGFILHGANAKRQLGRSQTSQKHNSHGN